MRCGDVLRSAGEMVGLTAARCTGEEEGRMVWIAGGERWPRPQIHRRAGADTTIAFTWIRVRLTLVDSRCAQAMCGHSSTLHGRRSAPRCSRLARDNDSAPLVVEWTRVVRECTARLPSHTRVQLILVPSCSLLCEHRGIQVSRHHACRGWRSLRRAPGSFWRYCAPPPSGRIWPRCSCCLRSP